MAHNAHTEDGKFVHRRVDRFSHPLDRPSEPDASTDSQGEEPPKVVTSVTLESEQLGLVGKLDLVSTDGDEAVPVETKRGHVPSNAQGAWEPERVQLMAQGLLLRANGWRCDHGYLYYAGSRRRVRVSFDAPLESRTLDLVHAARAQLLDTSIPDPLHDSPKCHGCSVAGICLPDETLALRQIPRDALAPSVRRLYPSRPDASPLYVQEQGAFVGIQRGVLSVKKQGEPLAEFRLKDIDHLVICGNVQLSTQAVHALCEAGIAICYLSTGHWFYGITAGTSLRNAYDRAAQYRAAESPHRRAELARALIAAKIANQRTLLMRNASPRPQDALNRLAALQPLVEACDDPSVLLGLEGTAARHYFGSFGLMLKDQDVATRFQAEGRARRPAPDPVNAVLSFGYALLARECTVALSAVGLDPYWGMYHRPRHGRPAFALDLMEEFRPLIVDSAVISAFNTEMISQNDFVVGATSCALRDTGRKSFIRAYEARMDQLVTHPVLGYRLGWRAMIRLQARLLARWLRGDVKRYRGMTTR